MKLKLRKDKESEWEIVKNIITDNLLSKYNYFFNNKSIVVQDFKSEFLKSYGKELRELKVFIEVQDQKEKNEKNKKFKGRNDRFKKSDASLVIYALKKDQSTLK